MARLWNCLRCGRVDLFVECQLPACEPGQAVINELPPGLTVAPGTRLVVAIAPEFTIGLVRPSGSARSPPSELTAARSHLPPAFAHLFAEA